MAEKKTEAPDEQPLPRMKHESFIEALAAAQSEYKVVKKNRTARVKTKTGAEYTYKYADLGDVLSMAIPIFARHGIAVIQPLKRFETATGNEMRVVTKLLWSSVEPPDLQSDGIAIAEDLDPQDFAAELSYWRRYDFCSLCGIAPEEDVDGRTSTTEPRILKQAEAEQVVKEFRGRAIEHARAKGEGGWFLRFMLHNEEAAFITFDPAVFELIESKALISGTADARRDAKKNAIWYKVTKVEAVPEQPASMSPFVAAAQPAKPATVRDALADSFSGPNAAKHRRLIETLLTKQPEELRVPMALNFAVRIAREKTTSEAGLLTALDIAVQEVKEDAQLDKQSEFFQTEEGKNEPTGDEEF